MLLGQIANLHTRVLKFSTNELHLPRQEERKKEGISRLDNVVLSVACLLYAFVCSDRYMPVCRTMDQTKQRYKQAHRERASIVMTYENDCQDGHVKVFR